MMPDSLQAIRIQARIYTQGGAAEDAWFQWRRKACELWWTCHLRKYYVSDNQTDVEEAYPHCERWYAAYRKYFGERT